ncbi:MAG: hypothetical protein ABSA39_08290 [Edaphobacter sp.]
MVSPVPSSQPPNSQPKKLVYWLILLISAATIISGLVQLLAPQFVLALVGADRNPISEQLFSTIGMFMAIFGGMLLQAMRSPSNQSVAIFWSALQKFGASSAVILGVERQVFSVVALAIATFDALSGCLILWYWFQVRR